jgi:Leucine-rich repeat (LRR) protein
MKKILLLSALLIFAYGCSKTTAITDANFEQALINLGIDSGKVNGSVATSNIADVTILRVNSQNISDLTGIEDFTALTLLMANNNKLTSVDLSNNTDLERLILIRNQLKSIDLSNNTDLFSLYLQENQLTSLDVSNNTSIELFSAEKNQLTSLDIRNGNNEKIWGFDVADNPNLTCIYVNNLSYMNEKFKYKLTDYDRIVSAPTFVINETECSALSLLDDEVN